MRPLPVLHLLILLPACAQPTVDTAPLDTGEPPESPWDLTAGEAVYDIEMLHEVEVEIDEDDWDELRRQQRNLLAILEGDCLEQPFDSPYTYFHADVTVDGERYQDVGIRKKGLLGSETNDNPSLKIRFDRYQDEQWHDEVDRLTLNNGRQDPAVISQCLGYELFQAAGVPASRCSFARVVVNGEDKGVYSNVEAVEPAMLARWYDDPEGRLWEGQLSDFREDWLGTYDVQEGDGDPAALEAVVEALAQPDDQVLSALEEVIDMDQWLTHWGMEVLVGHWDGYAGNSNNYFVYQDPSDGLLDFMPWGIDALFDSAYPFGSTLPTSVVATTALPRRLYLLEESQQAYYARLQELLDQLWSEDDILARIDAMESLVLPVADPYGSQGVAEAVDDIRGYVEGRRSTIEDEIQAGYPDWDSELRSNPCLVDMGDLPVSFETTWGSYGTQDMYSHGSGSMGFAYNGADYDVEFLGVVAGESHDDGVLLAVGRVEWGSLLALWLDFPLDMLADGTSYTMDWSRGQAYLYYDEAGTGEAWAVAAYLGNGPVVFDQASAESGASFTGSVDLNVYGGQ